jgi:hypothetical protein
MKRILFILSLGSWLLVLGSSPIYTDDAYYWAQTDTIVPIEPVYDRNAREFIFIEDTTQFPDTVVMRIIER